MMIFRNWILFFAVWMVCESALRVLLKHPWWDIASAMLFTAGNLVVGVGYALASGLVHVIALFILRAIRRTKRASPDRSIQPPARVTIALLVLPLMVMMAVQLFRSPRARQSDDAGIHSIVLISIDTLRHDYVGAYGAKHVHTPTIDRIASEGALFHVALAPVPETGPSHTSMFTGESPLQHGVRINGQRLSENERTFAVRLWKAGWKTAGFISGFPLNARNSGLDQGFHLYHDKLALKDYFNETYLGAWLARLPLFRRGVYRQAPEVTDQALKWLARNSRTPFFLFVHYFDPHYPYGIKAQLRDAKHPLYIRASPNELPLQKQRYAEEVELVDAQINRLVGWLRGRKIYDRTLVIVVADHGESLGEHNYYYDHGRYVYEPLVRVPLLVRYPAKIPANSEFGGPVSVTDVYKTILRAAGDAAVSSTDSFDLLELIEKAPPEYKRTVFAHNFTSRVNSIRADRWKLIETRKKRRTLYELYDLEKDPGEAENLFAIQPELSRRMLGQLHRAMEKYGTSSDSEHHSLSPEDREAFESLGYFDD